MAYEYSVGLSFAFGFAPAAATSTIALSTAFVFETSGPCGVVRFVSPVSQTNGALTVYAYPSATVTGNPTDVRCAVYQSATGTADVDRPDAGVAALATSSATDMTGFVARQWATFAIASVSLTQGAVYFLVFDNRTGTPGSHYPTLMCGGPAFERTGLFAQMRYLFVGGSSADGIATDPSLSSASTAAVVMTFAAGARLGIPFCLSSTHANNANSRGMRIRMSEDTVISGLVTTVVASTVTGFAIYATAGGAALLSATADRTTANLSGCYRFAPFTLAAGVSYDCMLLFSGNSTAGGVQSTGTGTIPDDVAACVPSWCLGYADGATPGSFTIDTTKAMPMAFLVDNGPLIDTPAPASVLSSDTVRGAAGTIATRTLSAANETVAEGYYAATTLSAVDADLAAANIVSGKTIFGFAGSAAGGGGGRPEIRGSNL